MSEINERPAADEERIVRIKRLVAPELAYFDEVVSAFQVRDKSDVSETLSHLDLIDHAEQRVLIAYSEATKDVNPTLGSEIARGSLKLTARLKKTLHRLCECSAAITH